MSTPAYIDRRDAPLRRYLIRELVKLGLSGRLWDVLMVIADECYGWEDKERKAQGQRVPRKDRNDFSYQNLAEACDTTFEAVSHAMRELMKMGIVKEYRKPTRTKSGEYGIISDPSLWNVDSSRKTATKNRVFGREKPRRIPRKTATNDPKKPHGGAGLPMPNLDLINLDTPIVPKGTEESPSFSVAVETYEQAVAHQSMAVDEAVIHASRAYTKRFARTVSKRESLDLQTFFSLSDFRGSLLAIWITALESAFNDRRERKADPDRQRYVARNPFADVYQFAADDYAERKAAQQDRPERLKAA